MRDEERRHKKFINPRIQGAVVLRFVVHFCVFVAVASALGLMLQFLTNPLRGISWNLREFWSNNGLLLIVLATMFPIFLWDTVKLTNRLVGPICRLRTVIHQINEGRDPGPLRLREGDFWQELATDFDTMVQQLRQGKRDHTEDELGGNRAESKVAAV